MNAITIPHAAGPAITPRDRRFGRESATPRLWHGGRVEATAIYNALSTTFPAGEAFFVESVRAFRAGVPPKRAEEIKGFTTQEAIHSREHDAFNRRAAEAGYDLSKLEARVEKRLAVTRGKPPIVSLGATMALEHFTAILAHQLLADPRHLQGADEQTAALWRWHAAEEIEHKGVAYDTWLHATRDWPRWKRWKVKAKVMLYVTRNFLVDRTLGALELMRQDGVTGVRAWAKLLWYLWVRPGMFRKIAGAWGRFFLPGFHPWNDDDRHLLAAYQASVGEVAESGRKVRRAV
jgi:predicted metal-dependent hydrolase